MRAHTHVSVLAVWLLATAGLGGTVRAQRPDAPPPTVEIVSTVGCAVKVAGPPPTWTLARAADPTVTSEPYASHDALDEARTPPLGSGNFLLVGVAEYLTEDDRQELSPATNQVVPFQKASTGQLQNGHHVAVRGLLVEVDGEPRINLTSVVSLDETCS